MIGKKSDHLIVQEVFNNIDPKVLETFDKTQIKALKNSIITNHNHLVDIRGIIPLFFMRFYFRVFVSRENSTSRMKIESTRRKQTDTIASIICVLFFVFPFWFLVFVVIYLTKVSLGIDIFPNFHLMDLFYPESRL